MAPAALTIVSQVPVLFLHFDVKLFILEFFPVLGSTSAMLSPEQVANASHSHARRFWSALSTLPGAVEEVKETQVLLGLLEETQFHNQQFEKLASYY